MRPDNLKTQIFLDSGEAKYTQQAIDILGFLDGQTTNPTLVSHNSQVQAKIAQGEKFSSIEIMTFYKKIVQEISSLIPQGSVSIEVYADEHSSVNDLLAQANDMYSWIPNAHIKLPITSAGLATAKTLVQQGKRVNMTLCFCQEQAAAVYAATKGAPRGNVFISPFDGRLDDIGQEGVDLILNILKMYQAGDGHVEVLAASIRNLEHFIELLKVKPDIVTLPYKIIQDWVKQGLALPATDYNHQHKDLADIDYHVFSLDKPWQSYNIQHELTSQGLNKFASDWNNLVK